MLAYTAKMNAAAARRALAAAERRERRMARRADTRADGWRSAIERKVPQKAAAGIEAAFSKAFALLFESGSGLIERSCRSGEMSALYSVRDYAVDLGSGGAELRRLFGGICRSNLRVTALTSVEGLALGALGIGLPDIVIFLAVLLRGVYSTAMGYGFDCASRREKFFVLKLMQAALSSGEERRRLGAEIDALMIDCPEPDEALFKKQMEAAASAFAVDMLAVKFIQGLPLIGVIGGAANPVYYRRIAGYAELKYRQRYLRGKLNASRTKAAAVPVRDAGIDPGLGGTTHEKLL